MKEKIRPIIMIVFTAGIWTGFFMGKINGDQLATMYSGLIGYYFGERTALKKPGEKND
jgi:uncharacterized membrane protein YfcA